MRCEKTYNIHYWIWLSLRCLPGNNSGDILLNAFDFNPKAIYEARREDYEAIGKLTENTIERLCDKDMTEAQRIRVWCMKNGVGLLAPDCELYPERLFNIPKRPLLLYTRGVLPDLDSSVLIACVGTRRMTEYGKREAYMISHDLALAGAVVVSGMAKGIDSTCHRGALDCGGKTIAVLGCGIDRIFPIENRPLYEELIVHGAIITEFKPGTAPLGPNFPIRNRIMSGLCQGTLVIEADSRSGALITARYAKEHGRDVFALPGKVGEQNSTGTNELIKSGAKPITEAADILDEYEALYPNAIFPEKLPVFRPKFIERASETPEGASRTPHRYEEKREQDENDGKESGKEKGRSEKRAERKAAKKKEAKEEPSAESETEKVVYIMPDGLSGDEISVWKALAATSAPLTADEIAQGVSLPVSRVMTALTLLEIKASVAALSGGRYRLC